MSSFGDFWKLNGETNTLKCVFVNTAHTNKGNISTLQPMTEPSVRSRHSPLKIDEPLNMPEEAVQSHNTAGEVVSAEIWEVPKDVLKLFVDACSLVSCWEPEQLTSWIGGDVSYTERRRRLDTQGTQRGVWLRRQNVYYPAADQSSW